MIKPKPSNPTFYISSPPLSYDSLLLSKMPLRARILLSVIMFGLVVLLHLIVNGGVLYPWSRCLASLDMGQEPIDVEQLRLGLKERVDLYRTKTEFNVNCREAFVMSKCPDAKDAEATILTVMGNVANKVDLNFTYIASYCTL
jgi:hypothetical protein